jgi:hypothetical protein
MLLTGAAALGTVTATGRGAEAAFTFTFQEQETDVVATGSVSVDLTGLSPIGEDDLRASGVSANNAVRRRNRHRLGLCRDNGSR